MAIIKFSSTIHSIRGQAGGTLFRTVGNKTIIYGKSWSNRGYTTQQSQARAGFAIHAGQWRSFTPEQQRMFYNNVTDIELNFKDKHSSVWSAFNSWAAYYQSGGGGGGLPTGKWNRAYANFCLGQIKLVQSPTYPNPIGIDPPSSFIVNNWAFVVQASDPVPIYITKPKLTWRAIYYYPYAPVATSFIDLSANLLFVFGQPLPRPYIQPLRVKIYDCYAAATANKSNGPSKYAILNMLVTLP